MTEYFVFSVVLFCLTSSTIPWYPVAAACYLCFMHMLVLLASSAAGAGAMLLVMTLLLVRCCCSAAAC